MGIKFRCPNGHKLNVKSHQAGKKGYCPKCKTQVNIPLKSTRKGKAEREAERLAADAQPAVPTADVSPAGTVPAPMPVATRISPLAEGPTTSLPSSPPLATTDPLTTNPDLIWYVRSTSGDQFGPAKGELFKNWIQEGRVGSDSLVWQEGWEDWKQAGEVFPQLASPPEPGDHLGATGTANDLASLNFGTTGPAETGTRSSASTRRTGSRNKSTNSTPIIVTLLAVASFALIGVLIWVLNTR